MATMRITERGLLDGYTGKANGGSNISIIEGQTIWWEYREGRDSDGYNCVCSRDQASEITLEYDRCGTILMSERNDSHPAIQRIHNAEQAMWGDRVEVR